MGCSRKIGVSECFDFQAGERVWVGKPPRLALHLPAEPTEQEDFRILPTVLTVGQKRPYGVRTVGLADKNSIYIKEKTWITVGVIQKQKGVDQ